MYEMIGRKLLLNVCTKRKMEQQVNNTKTKHAESFNTEIILYFTVPGCIR